jgi:amino acid transporter
MTTPSLKRSLSLPLLTFYGLGTIIGAGIYVLIGVVAGKAGMFTPLSFLLAAIIAAFTAFSYAELSSRLPRSAGEAVYIQEAFHRRWLSRLTGGSVVVIGVVSSATIANGFVGYLDTFIELPHWLAVTGLIIILGLIAAWGISQSVWLATLITLVEIGGLVYVILVGGESLLHLPLRWTEFIPPLTAESWRGIFIGAFLAFYAFIGFEDMVNVAEEVREAPRVLPRAIILALIISTLCYLSIAIVAVLAVPVGELAHSQAPLATVLQSSGHGHTLLISAIGIIAVINGALIQIIMASRVLYGMGNTHLVPALLARINPRTRTPLLATLLVTVAILALALWLPLVTLAQLTSIITLAVFTSVNIALIQLKRRNEHPSAFINIPRWVPWFGAGICLFFLFFQLVDLVQ